MKARRRRLVVTVSGLIAIGAFGSAAVAARPGGGTTASNTAPAAAVLSARRAPELLHTLVAETRLASRIRVFMRSVSSTSCVVVRGDDSTLLSVNPDTALTPASALKLTTAAAFLDEAGGSGRFKTAVFGRRPASGVVAGDIVLVGGGDPLLATPGYVETRKHPPKPATKLTDLVAELRNAGVRRVTGDLAVYDAAFDAERRVPSWSTGYTANGDVGPLGALAIDDGFSSYAPLIAAPDPAIAAGNALRAALSAAGVTVEGDVVRTSTKPTSPELGAVLSAPYKDVVAEMLRESDNNTAELLLKELARRASGAPGTRANGVAARKAALEKLGVASEGIQAIDGSGLDRSNRASCSALMATLTTKPGGLAVEDMLAVAAQTGTLDDRFRDSPLAGRLRAKTGSLNGVTALVGIADPKARVKLRFAFVSNGSFSDAGGKALQDRLVSSLATFPEAPAASKLAP